MIYIYGLTCPLTGRTRYIGKCRDLQHRLKGHIRKAESGEVKHHCARWIAKLIKKRLQPTIRVLIRLPDNGDWQAAERTTIARYRRAGFDLTNITAGGDGFHDLPADIIRRRVESRRRWLSMPGNKEKLFAAIRATKSNPEYKKRMGKIIAASWISLRQNYLSGMREPEAVLRRAAASKRRYDDPEFLRRHSETSARIWSTPERREEARQRAVSLHANPEIVERRKASLKAAHQRPDSMVKFAAARAEVAARPEVKRKKSDNTRRSWADPIEGAKRREALSSDECRAKMSESAKNKWKDPTIGARLREIYASPESRAKKAEAARRRATPEYRAMMAAKAKANWASGKRKKHKTRSDAKVRKGDSNAGKDDRDGPLLRPPPG